MCYLQTSGVVTMERIGENDKKPEESPQRRATHFGGRNFSFKKYMQNAGVEGKTSGKDLVTQKGYNRVRTSMTGKYSGHIFNKLNEDKKDKRNKNHVESLCLQKL